MSKIKLILPACFIAFFACSCSEKVTGTTEDENTVIAQGESSSSEVVGEPEPSEPESSSSIATSSSSKEELSSSSGTNLDPTSSSNGTDGGSGAGGIVFPPNRQCAAPAPARKAVYGVVDAFIQQRRDPRRARAKSRCGQGFRNRGTLPGTWHRHVIPGKPADYRRATGIHPVLPVQEPRKRFDQRDVTRTGQ